MFVVCFDRKRQNVNGVIDFEQVLSKKATSLVPLIATITYVLVYICYTCMIVL